MSIPVFYDYAFGLPIVHTIEQATASAIKATKEAIKESDF